ncbi:hypothetical protein BDZ90DRAFT_57201 [Jaminaea rosea]|uniref:Uncharacterized protein n=1 Tax=Jaminaea rosea TaxID=1569628 RepID=A0A316UM63_9BASI|nr:hypothetical protein BDZ90DRAFT_57201 [Jaminaea rosea]PWN26044.1 hypothetical protein BDZ90DRAFT_57201 [Jaminaea rosea]
MPLRAGLSETTTTSDRLRLLGSPFASCLSLCDCDCRREIASSSVDGSATRSAAASSEPLSPLDESRSLTLSTGPSLDRAENRSEDATTVTSDDIDWSDLAETFAGAACLAEQPRSIRGAWLRVPSSA